MRKKGTTIAALTFVTLAAFSNVSCNTINGVGRDFQLLGNKLQKTSNNAIQPAAALPQQLPQPSYQPQYQTPGY